MKKLLLLLSVCFSGIISAQSLPPNIQALYNEMFMMDTARGNFALAHNAQFVACPDSSSFYLQWFPQNTQPDTIPMIVTLHGSEGNVFNEFYLWQSFAAANNCGIIAFQWYMGVNATPPYDYLEDTVIYHNIETALGHINYPSGKALLHGFSRGSARSYAINFYDIQSGNNYFCTTISNAGSAEPAYPLYNDIDNGMYGPQPFLGRHWSLYCGGLDSGLQSNCNSMIATRNWLQAKGAIVDVFIQDPTGYHGGFHMNPANTDSIMEYYLQCFHGFPTGIAKTAEPEISIFPNPSSESVCVKIPQSQMNPYYRIELYDNIGRRVYTFPLLESTVWLHRIAAGNYTYVIFNRFEPVKKGKLIMN